VAQPEDVAVSSRPDAIQLMRMKRRVVDDRLRVRVISQPVEKHVEHDSIVLATS
jgi:hypothetical protein